MKGMLSTRSFIRKLLGFEEEWKDMKIAEKTHIVVSSVVIATLFAAIPFAVYEANWMALFVSVLTLFLILFPRIFEKRYKVKLIAEFHIVIILFIYAGLFLGEVRGYYTRFWWWDSVLHAFSGVALGFAGFLFLYILYKKDKFRAGFKMIAFFSFFFAVAMGALWEIFEFSVDSIFGADMQKSRGLEGDTRVGVMDTMWDMILNTIGAVIASVAGYFYLKKGEVPLIKRLVEKFEDKNPRIFNE